MVLLKNFVNVFRIPELRKKLFFTLGVLVVYRLGSHIPVIGIDTEVLSAKMAAAKTLGGVLSYLDQFSGGSLSKATLFALGISPYITSSIVMQLLGMSVPYFEQLLKEGEYGSKIINQYTRYLTFGTSILQSSIYATLLESQGLVLVPGWSFRLMFVFSLTVGSMFVMWLGEQISLFGIGNGSSMIIFAGIVAGFPNHVLAIWESMPGAIGLIILGIFLLVTASIVFLEKGERKIPVQYTRRVVGQRVYGGQSSYIPFKINPSGVMPVILAGVILNIPLFAITFIANKFESLAWLGQAFNNSSPVFNVMLFLLIIAMSFFYTALIFNPEDLADKIKKSGGFIPGIRPGKKTAEFFNYILTRLGLIGAIYLGCLALFPTVLAGLANISFPVGGTGLLIVVGVALEVAAQVESYLIEHRYEGFLSTGRLRGRGRS